MKAAVAVFLLFAAVFFFWLGNLLVSLLCIAVSAYVLLHKPMGGLGKELMKDLEAAEGQVPSKDVWMEGIKAAGAKTGEQLFSDKEETTRLKSMRTTRFKFKEDKIGEASKKTIDLFKKLFG